MSTRIELTRAQSGNRSGAIHLARVNGRIERENMGVSVYEIVTERVSNALKAGRIPWRKPWKDGFGGVGPISLSTGRSYRGVNRLLLSCEVTGFESSHWGTYRQIQELGGQVRKGEKSSLCTFWTMLKVQKSGELPKQVPFLRYFNVFNAVQCDGLDLPKPPKGRDFVPIEECERVIGAMPNAPRIEHDGAGRCYYSLSSDAVHMSKRESFRSDEGYYATLFHELAHSTGHAKRIGRELSGGLGSKSYAREELVAELSSAFLCAECHIDTIPIQENEAAYIQSWLGRLADDPKLLVVAAGAAQRAADFIMDRKAERSPESVEEPIAEPIAA